MEMSKDIFLNQLKTYIPADDYIIVGNIKGVSGASDDEGAANLAGWRGGSSTRATSRPARVRAEDGAGPDVLIILPAGYEIVEDFESA